MLPSSSRHRTLHKEQKNELLESGTDKVSGKRKHGRDKNKHAPRQEWKTWLQLSVAQGSYMCCTLEVDEPRSSNCVVSTWMVASSAQQGL